MNSPPSRRGLTGSLHIVPSGYYEANSFDHSQTNRPRGKAFILSADDEPLTLSTRQAILERSGYKVLSAADGRQALDIFAAHYVDLAILDYQMPRLDGAAVAREMKRLRPRVPILMVSGLSIEEDVKECVDSLFIKGQNPKLLLGEIERLLACSKFCARAAAGI